MKKALIATAIIAALGVGAYSLNTTSTSISDDQHGVEEKLAQTTSVAKESLVTEVAEGKETTSATKSLVNEVSEATPAKVESIVSKVEKPLMDIKEGVHYDTLSNQLVLPPHNGAIITEFFWLGCPHCQNFEPLVLKWKEMLNEDMTTMVSKVAVPGSARWNTDSKVFYTMKELDATDEQITAMLGLYGQEAQKYGKYPTDERIEFFFGEVGLDVKKAVSIFKDGSSLEDDLSFATQEFEKLNAGGVPAFVVNGKYKVRFDAVKSNDDIYEIFRALSKKK